MGRIRLIGDVPNLMTVKVQGEEINIFDKINNGIIRVNYDRKDKLVEFIKDLQRNNFSTNCHFGLDNTIHLQTTYIRRDDTSLFESNYIRINRLDDIIKTLNNITKDKIKIRFDKSLEDKSINELLNIKRRVTNRKRYKSEDSIKYIEV